MLALRFSQRPSLPRGRRLARPLQAEEQHDARRRRVLREPALGVAEQRQQLVADDLDDLLDRRQALQDRLVGRLVANAIDERLDDLKLTSASSSASRISRSAVSTCSWVRRTSPRRDVKALWMRVLSDSNKPLSYGNLTVCRKPESAYNRDANAAS